MFLREVAMQAALSSVKTLSPVDIAKKHNVSLSTVEQQLEVGIRHELEHTKNKSVAREIALDHLKEDPRYYEKLDAAMKENS